MNKKEKSLIIILGIVTILVIILIIVFSKNKMNLEDQPEANIETNAEKYVAELSNGTRLNVSEQLNAKKTYKSLEITNIQYTEKDGESLLLADITNKGTTTHETEIVKITILGENDEIITEIKPIIGEVKAGETIKLNASITADIVNAKDFTIEEIN